MSTRRYSGADKFINRNKIYKNILKDRGIKQVEQYATRNLTFPTKSQMQELNVIAHTWVYGDRYYKLAHEHYGDANLWWVIAFFNQQPTEVNLAFGTIIYIPHPLERIMNFYGV